MSPRSTPALDETPLVLAPATELDTLVRARGTTFVVTNRAGNVGPPGARELGFFHDDTRYLSHYELSLRGHTLVYLSSNAFDPAVNRIDLMVACAGTQELLDDPKNFLHVRRRQLVDSAFREQIELVNYLQRTIVIEVILSFAADFADVFEIRGARRIHRGISRSPVVENDSVEIAYEGLDNHTYVSHLKFAPAPSRLSDHQASFELSIEPGGEATVEVSVLPTRSPHTKRDTPRRRDFEGRVRSEREAAERFFEESTRFRCDNAVIENVLTQSSADLRALAVGIRGHRVLAAGIPWFSCPFGRDTLLAGYEALPLNPELAASSLRALATLQGKKFDDFTEEEPGKIFHELRFGEMAACNEIPHGPYYGTIDATPLFVVVAHATYKVTGDVNLVRELGSPIREALAWIDRKSADGTRLVTYERKSPRGLDNQGWKDSRAGVSFPSAERAEPPIALSEVQGYCADAYRRGSELLLVLGAVEGARIYGERARSMADVVEQSMWLPAEGRYAFAVDGHGRALPTIVSNVGHLLWSRVPPIDHARATADVLLSPESLSTFGVRTLAAGQPVYNPLSYHNGTVWPHDNAIIAKGCANYDLMDQACSIFERLVTAMGHFPDRRLPELFCGMSKDDTLVRYPVACSPQAWAAAAPFLLLQAVLGIHIDGAHQRLLVRNPKLPQSVSRFELDGLRVGRSRVSLRLRRVGRRCHVDRLDVVGAPLRTFVEIE